MNGVTIALPKQKKEQLTRLALRYGLSLEKLSRSVIEEAAKQLLEIPEESLDEYENAEEIKKAYHEALHLYSHGKLIRSLPKSIRPRRTRSKS